MSVKGDVAGAGYAHADGVPAIRETKRLLLCDPTPPIKRYTFNTGGKAHSGLKTESLYVTGINRTISVEVHDYSECSLTDCLNGRRVVTTNRVRARPFNIARKLSRRIHQADMLACATDTNDGETSDDHGNGDRDE